MPNRIIKESAFTSDTIAQLSDFEFRLWVGLITQADDAGRGDARPAIIKGRVFALRERVAVKDIDSALHALAAAGCVFLYTVGGKPYFQFPSWAAHQRIRDAKPKYPGPEEGEILTTRRDSPQLAANCGLNPIQSESNTNPNPKESYNARAKNFIPPSVAEVAEYCKERQNGIDAQRFVDYYESRGWMLGKTRMKDWRAAVRTWERGSDKGVITDATAEDAARQVAHYGFDEDLQESLDRTLKKLKGGS